MKETKKKGRVYRRMYLTYIVVLCIPVLFSVLFYYYTYQEVAQEALFYNGNLLTTVKNTCDDKLGYYQGVTYQLKMDDDVQRMVDGSRFKTPESFWNSYLVKNQLAGMKESMGINGLGCKDIFLYLDESGKVISSGSTISYTWYSQQTLSLSEETAKELLELMKNQTMSSIEYLENESGEGYFLFLQPAMRSNGKIGDAVIGIVVEINGIDVQNQSIDWEGGMDWAMTDSQKRIVRKPEILSAADMILPDISEGEKIELGGREYLVSVVASEICDWEYFLFTPIEMVNESASEIRTVYLLSLIMILIVSYFIMKQVMKLTYSPLEKMVDTLKNGMNEEDEENDEYRYLSGQVSRLVEKANKNQKSLHKNKDVIRSFTIEQLLMLPKIDADSPKYSRDFLKKFEEGKNIVLLFCVMDPADKTEQKNTPEEEYLNRFIVSNVMGEEIEKFFRQEIYVLGDKIVSMIHLAPGSEDYSEILQELTEKIRQFMAEKFQLDFHTLEGGAHEGLMGIRKSYLEACRSEEFGAELQERYIRYEDIKDRTVRRYQYSFEMEQLLVNAIRSNNRELAISIINNIVDNNFKEAVGSRTEMTKCLIYDVFSTLLKASEDVGISIDRIPNVNRLFECATEDVVREYFTNIVQTICQESKETAINQQKQVFCQDVKTYIEEHFQDPDMNISQIALEFQISPAYLSSVYRKYTGESILDVIRECRIEYAKQLLNEGCSVTEVSQKVGFRESTTFVRSFKKHTGFTPGQLRKVDKNRPD